MKRVNKMKIKRIGFWSTIFMLMGMLTSCLEGEGNTYRITATTFATVTNNGAGSYRLFLDENRGILEPTEDSPIKWGNAERVLLQYDIPFADTITDNTRFKSIVRSATKVPVVPLIDVTGLSQLPDSLGNDGVINLDITAYRGYLTIHTIVERSRTGKYSLYYSYDTDAFKGDTLNLNLHYRYSDENSTSSDYVNHLECAVIPEFVRNKVVGDSLYVTLSADMWRDSNKTETERVSRCVSVSKRRLTPPTYIAY